MPILKNALRHEGVLYCNKFYLTTSILKFQVLSEKFRLDYSQLWLSILNKDRDRMREQCAKLGIEGNLYAILTCMITGRTWDSILSGINETKQGTAEVSFDKMKIHNYIF